jgi:hypothetical protein
MEGEDNTRPETETLSQNYGKYETMQNSQPRPAEVQIIQEFINPENLVNTRPELILDPSEIDSDTSSFLALYESDSLASEIDMEGAYELLKSDADTEDLSLSSDVSDDIHDHRCKLTSEPSDENEVDAVTILDERLTKGPNGTMQEYLVQCWISQKHMELFRELMRMS